MAAERLIVVGGGLAGSEAAWQAANQGIEVELWEARPEVRTPAHATLYLGELVCSNSLGADVPQTPAGLLKAELRRLGSVIMAAADAHRVAAGRALAVDRLAFARSITARLATHPRIRLRRGEVGGLPEGPAVIATGPLTSPRMVEALRRELSAACLHFYDAAAPIVTGDSVDLSKAFWGSRYEREGRDYLNCPLTRDEYEAFWEALVKAETVPLAEIDKPLFFEGCLPVEELARRGRDTLRFGPLKPVGLTDPRTGRRPYAVVQLRREDEAGRLLNLVGFQTRLRWGAQDAVFRLIPALAGAEFVRYGVMHRNTYLEAPSVLAPTFEVKDRPGLFLAGQLVGVEGYLESTAAGLLAGINAARRLRGKEPVALPEETMIGALAAFITRPRPEVQPMNANYGLLPPLPMRVRDQKERRRRLEQRAEEVLSKFLSCLKVTN
ncbi:MAG TPA: FADH(2)-oxidizing methylenetetrahydrofolate--tRNA-(uracil(54)-C(5))-methyltransferase TrmFO [Firmicutes bacterium]|nr:FADH(2)-oxidizing methylenetetrahydrofolate--tRNA-(uracil(54)-C(5))-methyltransferase TrmFO [Bacillota bacterium]